MIPDYIDALPFLQLLLNKHNKTSQSSLLVIIDKRCFLNVLVSERCGMLYGFVTAIVFNAVYSTCSIEYKSPRLRDI